jgi:hypothetical protein
MAMNPRLLRPTAGFDPRSIPGLSIWLDGADRSRMFSDDAATTIAADGGQVAVYKDKANDILLSQTTANNRPLVVAGARNGRSVLDFDGSNDSLSSPSLSQGWFLFTAFCVLRMDSKGGADFGRIFERGAGLRAWVRAFDTLQFIADSRVNQTAASSFVDSQWYFCTGLRFSSVDFLQRINGAQSGTMSGSLAAVSDVNTVVTIGNRSAGDRGLDGYMAELMIYSQALSSGAIEAVESYLKSKWGL